MVATYNVPALDIAFAANKCMAGVYNGSGSGKVIKVYRIWMLNNQQVAVTGVLTNVELRKITAASGGTDIVPSRNDSSSAALPAQVKVGTNMTVTLGGVLKRIIWSTDEPGSNAVTTLDELECIVPLGCVWEMGYGDPYATPLTLREGDGIALYNTGGSVGQCDIFIEMTAE